MYWLLIFILEVFDHVSMIYISCPSFSFFSLLVYSSAAKSYVQQKQVFKADFLCDYLPQNVLCQYQTFLQKSPLSAKIVGVIEHTLKLCQRTPGLAPIIKL